MHFEKKYALCSTRTSCEKEAGVAHFVAYEEAATTWMPVMCFTMLVLLTVTMTESDLFVLAMCIFLSMCYTSFIRESLKKVVKKRREKKERRDEERRIV